MLHTKRTRRAEPVPDFFYIATVAIAAAAILGIATTAYGSSSASSLSNGLDPAILLSIAVLTALAAAAAIARWCLLRASFRKGMEAQNLLSSLSNDMIFRITADGSCTYVSSACERVLGYTPEQMMSMDPLKPVYPEDRSQMIEFMAQIMNGEGDAARVLTTRLQHRNGHLIWVETSHRLIRDPRTGKLIEFFGFSREVTERVKVEIALRQSEERFRNAFETAAHGVVLVSLKARGLRVNKTFCTMSGYREEELIDANFHHLVHPDDRKNDADQIAALLAGEVETYQIEKRQFHKQGHIIWILLSVSLTRTVEGTPVEFVCQVQDITRRKQAELALQENEERFRTLYNKTPGMMHSTDRQGRLLTVSDLWLKSMGYERDDVIGRNVLEFFTEESQALANTVILPGFFQSGFIDSVPHQFIKKDGTCMDVLLSAITEKDSDGEIIRSLVILVDVTARRRAETALLIAREEAERANRAKSSFLATMSHEIRTPLNGIVGFADILLETPLSNDQRQKMGYLKQACSSLLAIVNDVLDISKIEAGKLTLERIPVNLQELATSTTGIVSAQAQAKGLDLILNIQPDLPDWILGDPVRLRQVLLNFLSNAIKFTDTGSVTLDIAPDDTIPGNIAFGVSDTGIGIAPECQHLLFQDFSQVDRPKLRQSDGTGLGLAISKLLVEAMNMGRIGMSSQLGAGSRFWFSIGLEPTIAPVQPSAAPMIEHLHAASARILVVDDVQLNQILLQMMLSNNGHMVTSACNGLEAWEMIQRDDFDLVLMDLEMPVLDGLNATRAIRTLNYRKRNVPIIALTANVLSGEIAACREAGMNDYVSKPIDRKKLLATIARWINTNNLSIAADMSDTAFVRDPEQTSELASYVGAETMADLTAMFLQQLQEVQESLASVADRPGVLRAAHDLYSTSGTLGFVEISECCRSLQESLHADCAADDLETLVGSLTIAMERACEALRLDPPRALLPSQETDSENKLLLGVYDAEAYPVLDRR